MKLQRIKGVIHAGLAPSWRGTSRSRSCCRVQLARALTEDAFTLGGFEPRSVDPNARAEVGYVDDVLGRLPDVGEVPHYLRLGGEGGVDLPAIVSYIRRP